MRKAIAILGGMGPEASSYMYNCLINLAISGFGAKDNDQFPEIILHSIPVPDFISSDKDQKVALEMLKKRVKDLNKLDISSLAIACNTAHILLPELQKISRAPFVSMVEEITKEVVTQKRKTIGIMGTPSTLRYKLYQTPLENAGIRVLVPNSLQINVLETVIRNVIAGKLLKSDTRKILKIADSLKNQGAEAIILGCTELPLVFPKKYFLPVFNSTLVLSKALLRNYYKVNTISSRK